MSVIQVRDGAQAIEIFRREHASIHCVLLDLCMPRPDGEEVFAALRSIDRDVRVVLTSGFTEQEVLDRFRGAGLSGVLQKPARRDVLLARIGEALRPAEALETKGS